MTIRLFWLVYLTATLSFILLALGSNTVSRYVVISAHVLLVCFILCMMIVSKNERNRGKLLKDTESLREIHADLTAKISTATSQIAYHESRKSLLTEEMVELHHRVIDLRSEAARHAAEDIRGGHVIELKEFPLYSNRLKERLFPKQKELPPSPLDIILNDDSDSV